MRVDEVAILTHPQNSESPHAHAPRPILGNANESPTREASAKLRVVAKPVSTVASAAVVAAMVVVVAAGARALAPVRATVAAAAEVSMVRRFTLVDRTMASSSSSYSDELAFRVAMPIVVVVVLVVVVAGPSRTTLRGNTRLSDGATKARPMRVRARATISRLWQLCQDFSPTGYG